LFISKMSSSLNSFLLTRASSTLTSPNLQHTKPEAIQSRRRLLPSSLGVLTHSFSITAIRLPCCSVRMWFRSVCPRSQPCGHGGFSQAGNQMPLEPTVLPLPRNPVMTVTGILLSARVAAMFGPAAHPPGQGFRGAGSLKAIPTAP
jgi:hypothetical protein